jgi:flagellar FliL protein
MAKTKTADVEADAPDEEGSAAPKRSFLSRRNLLIAAPSTLLLTGGGASYFFFFRSAHKEEKPVVVAVKPPAFFDVPDILVNLSAPAGERGQYLKVKLVLEIADSSVAQQIQPVMPRVMDAFQVFLRELRASDLDGSAGMFRLKEELTRRVNTAIAPSRINAVLFKEMVIQ